MLPPEGLGEEEVGPEPRRKTAMSRVGVAGEMTTAGGEKVRFYFFVLCFCYYSTYQQIKFKFKFKKKFSNTSHH